MLDLRNVDGQDGFKLLGDTHHHGSGASVSSAGDVNGDGFDDVLVGTTAADANGANSGGAYVFFGKADSFDPIVDIGDLDGNNGFAINGRAAGDTAGQAVAAAGDINGDGFDDLIVGAPNAHANDSGTTYVIFGSRPGEAVARTGSEIANTIHGGDFADTLSGLGGDDILIGYAGDDVFTGGDGMDTVSYAGVAGGVIISLHFITPQNVGAGQGSDSFLGVENLVGTSSIDALYGSNAANAFYGGAGGDTLDGAGGSDTLYGGTGSDSFWLTGGGNDTVYGGDDFDTFNFGITFSANDKVDGGTGFDTLILAGDYSAGIVFGAATMVNVEAIQVSPDYSNVLTLNDATVGENKSLYIDFSFASAPHALTVDGSREKDGFLNFTGGYGADVLGGGYRTDLLRGNAGNDTLTGGRGGDTLEGGAGADTFVYAGAKDSGGVRHDKIAGFDAQADKFDLTKAVTGIDTVVSAGSLSTASFKTDLKGLADKEHLGSHHALLVTADAGDLAGVTFLIVDLDGRTGYGSAHDLVVRLDAGTNLNNLDVSDFI